MRPAFDTAYFFAWVLAFILGVAFQKFCQAFVAERLGDPTPRSKNRVTLNPFAHHEPLGLVFAFFLSVGTTAITWGKPLELNTFRIRGGRLGRSLVALVGPLSFFLLAFLVWLASKSYLLGAGRTDFFAQLLINLISVLLTLCAFNLIPIYPMDGYEIIKNLLPADWEPRLLWVEQYGILILIGLVLLLPFFLQGFNPLFEFYVLPVIRALAGLLGITLF